MNSCTQVASTASALILVTGLLTGCAPDPGMDDDEASDASTDVVEADASSARVLLCQQGLSDRTTGWDKGLFDLCETAGANGLTLIWDGDYPAFGALDEDGAYDALFAELDTNGDGYVTQADTATAIHLVGFSWGGINVTDIAYWLQYDDRIIPARRGVSVMVLLDPYQPQRWTATIPANVSRVWEYAQSETTAGDCSSDVSLGAGFNGLPPRMKSSRTYCAQYDLDAFAGEVGHCDVPAVARDAALVNLLRRANYAPWKAFKEDC